MAKLKLALEPGGPKRLVIKHWFFRNVTISLDGSSIGFIADRKSLAQGYALRLPGGEKLEIGLANTLEGTLLLVLRDGLPLPGSAADPVSRMHHSAAAAFFIGAVNIVVGTFTSSVGLFAPWLGPFQLIFGILFTVMGVFIWRGSRIALGAALTVFILDGLSWLVGWAATGQPPAIGATILRLAMTVLLARGFTGPRIVARRRSEVPPPYGAPVPYVGRLRGGPSPPGDIVARGPTADGTRCEGQCPICGLMNFRGSHVCRRCGCALSAQDTYAGLGTTAAAGLSPEADSQPRQESGAWTHGNLAGSALPLPWLAWAIVTITVGGLVVLAGLLSSMRRVGMGTVVMSLFTVLSFLILAGVDGVFAWVLLRSTRAVQREEALSQKDVDETGTDTSPTRDRDAT